MTGIGRSSRREALPALAVMRVIESRQGSGAFATSLRPEHSIEHLGFAWSLDDTAFLDLFPARKSTGLGLASLADRRFTAEEIESLRECLERTAISLAEPEALVQPELETRRRIMDAGRRPSLGLFVSPIAQPNEASRGRAVELPDVRRSALADDHGTVAAQEDRDPQVAVEAMSGHLERVEQKLKEMSPMGEETVEGGERR